MEKQPYELHDEASAKMIEQIMNADLTTEEGAALVKNFRTFTESQPHRPDPALDPDPVPTTWYGKTARKVGCALETETARTLIKAGAHLGGVALLVFATIKRDHVLERQVFDLAKSARL
jgi:DNA-binding transcriptional regulator PaaX